MAYGLFLGLAIGVSILSVIGSILLYRHKVEKTLNTLDRMLDKAIEGKFLETHFDESLLSAVEVKLANYLKAAEVSANHLKEEKEKIKGFISDISHQTKTPIANILLYSQLLKEKELPLESIECVEALNSQAEKLSFLIGALVKTSRLDAGMIVLHPKATPLAQLMETVLSEVMPKAVQKGIQIICEPVEGEAIFDLKWTSEAVYNLLDNAVKYTQAGGQVILCTTSYELFCRIDVMDTGIGIAEEEQSQIFKRFYRSPRVNDEEGVGIGLYLTRQIVSEQGGYLKVRSHIGEGATFSLFLPKAS